MIHALRAPVIPCRLRYLSDWNLEYSSTLLSVRFVTTFFDPRLPDCATAPDSETD